uniref:Uncharacterized protein n=1 Tax=Pristionchus pacificus TaxID=54126 RepID=A0A2A6CFP8_PRIPA|eukprot:PDM76873.1 hypothetical protein PRIPAC_42268 [Pristionchus pacificus]
MVPEQYGIKEQLAGFRVGQWSISSEPPTTHSNDGQLMTGAAKCGVGVTLEYRAFELLRK